VTGQQLQRQIDAHHVEQDVQDQDDDQDTTHPGQRDAGPLFAVDEDHHHLHDHNGQQAVAGTMVGQVDEGQDQDTSHGQEQPHEAGHRGA